MDGRTNVEAAPHVKVRRIGGNIGAEISGVDLRKLSEADFATLQRAWYDHSMILMRGQTLSDDDLLAFSRRFGELDIHPTSRMAGHPEIIEIKKSEGDKRNFGGTWHTDQMFSPSPAMGTMLYAKQVPSAGGDTLYTNQYLAYESLSDGMKRLAETQKFYGMHYRGKTYDTGDFAAHLARAQELAAFGGFAQRRAQARKRGRLRGIGIANGVAIGQIAEPWSGTAAIRAKRGFHPGVPGSGPP